jgi:hypothetical protein
LDPGWSRTYTDTVSTHENTHATVPVYTRLETDLAERLQQEARDEDRTMAAHVRHLIKKGLTPSHQGVSEKG